MRRVGRCSPSATQHTVLRETHAFDRLCGQVAVDYGQLLPEVHSVRMFSGTDADRRQRLGQAGSAIAACDADYEQMWARDAETLEASLAPVTGPLSRLSSLSAPSGIAISQLNSLNKAAALRCLLPSRKDAGVTISAGFGRARSIGTLSVPHGWSAAATSVPFRPGTVA